MSCDRCGCDYEKPIDETFRIEVVDRPFKVDESLDVVECPDGIVDFDDIFKSEINAIKSEYHLCADCAQDETFEIEF